MTSWTIRDVPVPASLDAPDAWLLLGAVDVHRAARVHTWGDADLVDPPSVVLAELRDRSYEPQQMRVAVADDGPDAPERVLGRSRLVLPMADNRHTCWGGVDVRPEHRGRGIGSALHDDWLDAAKAAGRTKATAGVDQAVEPEPGPTTLAPPTGEGLVDAADPDLRFALSRGWALEQVERRSVLDLPLDADVLARFTAQAAAAAGPDYRLLTWGTITPPEWVDQYAVLVGRMSTDAPSAGIDWGAEAWDADRVHARQAQLADGGMELLQSVVEHVPSRTLVAFTNFWMPPLSPHYVHQGDTLVLPEHRGHRLGMLVKCANLARLAEQRPQVRRVGTWNAEENRWMLAINVALGFRPAGGTAALQRDL